MPSIADQLQEIIEPLLVAHGLELFDLEHGGGRVLVTVDRPGGPDVDGIAEATRTISRALDAHDVIPGRYTLEVSSPGLERVLRTPRHFTWAVGREVKLKLLPSAAGDRRLVGLLEAFDPDAGTLTLAPVVPSADPSADRITVAVAEVDRARTVFTWGANPKPESPSKANKPRKGAGGPAREKRVTA